MQRSSVEGNSRERVEGMFADKEEIHKDLSLLRKEIVGKG